MKILCFSILILVTNFAIPKPKSINPATLTAQADSTLAKLKSKKDAVDQYISKHKKDLIILVKIPGKEKLVVVKNEHWPEEIEYTYNILKNPAGKIVLIAQVPFSESGDWNIVYKHYFDEDGNVYAFSKEESIFNDNVKGGVVRNMLVNYYDKKFKNIAQTDRLTDKDNKSIKGDKSNYDFRDYKYDIYKTLNECLKGYNIQLTN
jgi:hypothetical protein